MELLKSTRKENSPRRHNTLGEKVARVEGEKEIIAEARKGRIHILDPTETDPGGARSRDPYPDSSCKITRVRALERRRVYSRKIALACTSQGTSMCIRCTYYIYSYTSTIYLGKQGELHEISLLTEYCVLVTPYDFNCNQIFR